MTEEVEYRVGVFYGAKVTLGEAVKALRDVITANVDLKVILRRPTKTYDEGSIPEKKRHKSLEMGWVRSDVFEDSASLIEELMDAEDSGWETRVVPPNQEDIEKHLPVCGIENWGNWAMELLGKDCLLKVRDSINVYTGQDEGVMFFYYTPKALGFSVGCNSCAIPRCIIPGVQTEGSDAEFISETMGILKIMDFNLGWFAVSYCR